MSKKVKEVKPTVTKVYNGIPTSGIAGIAILFVCVSIGYANYTVFFGVDNLIAKLMLIPSTLFVAGFLVVKALK